MRGKDLRARWASRNYGTWKRHLIPYFADGRDKIYIEIGVFEGRSAMWMMDNICTSEGSKAYLIDTWQGPSGQRLKEKLMKWGTGEEIESRARKNMSSYGSRVEILRGTSEDMLKTETIAELAGAVDLVYIDGAHDGDLPYKDAVGTWPLLRSGGVQMWDDCDQEDVAKCVSRFCEEYGPVMDVMWKEGRTCGVKKI